MSLKRFVFLLLIFIVAVAPALAQRDSISLATLAAKTDKLSTEYPFEKVYLHFDKPYYAVGDTIWFKAYLTVGAAHQVSGLSNIVYADLINSKDSLVRSLRMSAINGVAFGNIALTRAMFKQGNYHIRAYTNWMRNFGPDYFFNKTISIGDFEGQPIPKVTMQITKKGNGQAVNTKVLFKDRSGNAYADKKVSWTVQNGDETVTKGKGVSDKNGLVVVNFTDNTSGSSNDAQLITMIELGSKKLINSFPIKNSLAADVQFFPEGGDLIAGVRSKVAFKALNTDGVGVDVTGTVVDNAGNEVADLTSQHNGMGIFALLPEGNKTYKANVTFPDGAKGEYELPKVNTDGINLAVNNNDPENLTIKIATNAGYFQKNKNRGYYIIAQSGGTICYTGLAALQSQVYTGMVPKSKFPTGVLQVTLFAADGEPLSERVVFIQHNDALNIGLSADLPAYTSKQHVKMTVSSKNKALPVEGTFSVSVIDETEVPFDENAETTILSSILLTSDLRGYIEKPNYYFNHIDDKKLADLDILMLTQGYRRFSYTDIFEDKYPPKTFLPEKGMEITGVLRTSSGLPVNKGVVNMVLPDRNVSVNAVTDVSGQFSFQNVAVFDSSKVILNARNNSGYNGMMIMADVPRHQPVTKSYPDPGAIANIDSALSFYLQNAKKRNENSHMLKEVVITGSKIEKVTHPEYTALMGVSADADQTLTAEKLKYCSFDLVSCIQNKTFGLWYFEDEFYIKRYYDKGDKRPVEFFVNGVPMDFGFITTIKTEEVTSIDVYLTDGVSGINNRYGTNGIVSITLTNGSFNLKQKYDNSNLLALATQTGVVTITPKGYFRARMFYSPKYENKDQAQNADLRNTIYWNPNITTDKNGESSFDYYNADGKGTYKAVIEGIDNEGNIGRTVLRYQVK
ncbi:MAG TPA: Ig-like domain-containing protein [Mucilaginibacter sp.]|jgi:hypothetical protein